MSGLFSPSGVTPEHEASWEEALSREWLMTDGLGGYASGTVLGPNTRRYHGTLVAPFAPPLGRHVLVAKVEEALSAGGATYDLSANEFQGGTVAPRGYEHLTAFELVDGIPTWCYRAGDGTLVKRVWMDRGQSTTVLSYTWEGDRTPGGATPARLHLTPLCCFRDFHRETIGSDDWRFRVEPLETAQLGDSLTGGFRVSAYAGATPYYLLLRAPAGAAWAFGGEPGWWWQFLHRAERERGLDHAEDLYAIGTLTCDVAPGETLLLAATTADPGEAAARMASAGYRPRPAGEPAGMGEPSFVTQLRRGAHDFLVPRSVPGQPNALLADGTPAARTVLAGYHWFGDWGRDTMIALPGLALATGRFDEARAILLAFGHYVDRGMLPNRFPDSGAPLNDGDYNTIDATLWYFHAIDAIDRATGGGLVEALFPVLEEIVRWHVQGTRFGIRVDPADGLVRCDDPQLTWMDAKVGDWVCTPRAGKPVEIQALWIHALALMEGWASRAGRGDQAAQYAALRQRASSGFAARFWNHERGCLYDLVDGPQGDDGSVRPNQAVAAALPDCPLSAEQRRGVVDTLVAQLWTPRGLRTLATDDPAYRGHYGGDPWSRDGAYHQGTVWPWLLGPLVDAHLLVHGDRAAARALVAPVQEHLFAGGCAGSVNEIFDGDAPHAPRGCIAQAWSVAEVYRAWAATDDKDEADSPLATR